MDGECMNCGEVGNWCRCDEGNEMNFDQEIQNLNSQIVQLTEKRNNLLNQKNLGDENYIKSLKWCQNCTARLELNTLYAAGLPKYKLHVYGNTPATNGVLEFFPDLKYPNNICFSSKNFDSNGSYFYTNSIEALMRLINDAEFKSIEYDKEHLQLLTFIASQE